MNSNRTSQAAKVAFRGLLAIAMGVAVMSASAEVDPETCMARCREHKIAEDKCQRICKPKQDEDKNPSAFAALKS